MKRITTLIFLMLRMLYSFAQSSNTDVTLSVGITPPYSPNLHDYANFLKQTVLTIHNNTGVALNLRFIATVKNISEGWQFKTKSNLPVKPYTIQGGDQQIITGDQGDQVFSSPDIDNYETDASEAIKKNIVLTGILPDGNYQLCIQAFNYDVPGVELSQPDASCAMFTITYVQPPVVVQPMCGISVNALTPQQLIISWMPATGNIMGGVINYDLYMVMVPDGISPSDAMDAAVQANAGVFVFHKTQLPDNQFIYGVTELPLAEGNYAVEVIASDPTGTLNFANKGRSAVCSFFYKKGIEPESPAPIVEESHISCSSCQTIAPVNTLPDVSNLQPGKLIKFGNQEVAITEVTVNPTTKKASGRGILKFLKVPVRVDFSDVAVNNLNEVLSGQGAAALRPGISFLPKVPTPDLSPMPLSSDQITYIDKFAADNAAYLVSNIENSVSAIGFELPLGLDENILGVKTVIAITGLHLSPAASAFDAAAVIDVPEAGTKIPLGARNVCMKPGGICGDGVLFLSGDINLPSLNMKLKGVSSASDTGTYVRFRDFGFDKLRIKAQYDFPAGMITSKANPGEKVTVTILGEGRSWSDWMASVAFNPFVINGVEDLAFSLAGDAVYDHSSVSNPAGIPGSLVTANTWTGFYLPRLKMTLPEIIRSVNDPNPVSASVTDLIIDGDGVSGNINAENVLNIGSGSLDSWYFSIEKIYARFRKNSFEDAGMDGKIVLPISENKSQNQLGYHSTLTSSASGKIGFEFVVQPKNNIEVPVWYAQFTLANSSSIRVEYKGDSLKAIADLSGKMDIVIKEVSDVKIDVKFKLMEVQHLKLMTYSPYVECTSFTAGMASPQKDIDGFDVSLKEIGLASEDGLVGPKFKVGINLSSLGALPTATFGFSVLGKPGIKEKRPYWEFKKCEPTYIEVEGPLGPAEVKGKIEFFNKDPKWGNGIRGGLKVSVVSMLSVDCQSLFGTKDDYNYFYLDANVTLPVPLPISVLPAPPISVFGIGEGFYYHLSTVKNTRGPLALLAANTSELTNKYEPNPHTAGFNGNIVLGMSDGSTMMAKCSIDATVNIDGGNFGLEKIEFRGDFYTMCEPGNMTNAIGKGSGVMTFDFANKVFDLQCAYVVEASLGPLTLQKINATLDLHIAPVSTSGVDWYLKIGEPGRPIEMYPFPVFPFPYTVWNYLITGKGYFMTGNSIPTAMVLNDKVRMKFSSIEDEVRNSSDLQKGQAIVFGAGLFLPKVDETFLCFYIKFDGGIGFDFKFDKLTADCKGVSGSPGFNGYYANGQFYAYFEYDFGLDVDLWFYKGRVSAGRTACGAILRAGLPNPTWFQGELYAEYSVLGDQISGHMNFRLKVGEKCVATKSTFGNGLPIVSEIKPENAEGGEGIDVDHAVAVGFNYPVEKVFTISDRDDNGKTIDRSFKIKIDYFNVVEYPENTIVISKDDSQEKSWDYYHKTLIMYPAKSYTPNKQHKTEIKVTAYEIIGGKEVICKVNSRSDENVVETKDALFKTGGCPQTLKGKVLASYPCPGQRFLLQEENDRKGSLILPTEYTCMNNDLKYDLKVRFTCYKNGQYSGPPEDVDGTVSGNTLTFPIPNLPNEALVNLTVLKKPKPGKYDGMVLSNQQVAVSYVQTSMLSAESNDIYMKKTSIETSNARKEIELYYFYFMTSKFNNLYDKISAMGNTAKTSAVRNNDAMEDMEIRIPSKEAFDVYDLEGQKYNANIHFYDPGKQFYIPPVIDVREADSDLGWRSSFVKPYFGNYFNLANFGSDNPVWSRLSLSFIDQNEYFGTNVSNCFLNPVIFSNENPPLPPLSDYEINAQLPKIINENPVEGFAILKNY